jgi:hypothetical protein
LAEFLFGVQIADPTDSALDIVNLTNPLKLFEVQVTPGLALMEDLTGLNVSPQ